MKTTSIAIFALVSGGIALAQGPLTPPPGYDPNIGPANALNGSGLPQATMKTLHQVEPRTAIAGGTSGVTISASGAYYLAGNITVATGDGITINASHVTLDLNGFSVTTSAAPAAGIGVRLGQGLRNVAIRNGNIGGDGLGGAFTGGVYYVVSGFPQPPSNLRVADLSVAASEYGISTSNSVATCHVERCMIIGGSVHGIQGGIVKDCVVEGGPIFGRIVKDCSVTTPGTSGIVADVVENCYATSAGTAIQAKCLVNSYGSASGFSSYTNHTISAGVASNVWAEGQGGSANALDATTVNSSIGTRVNDPFPLPGAESNAVATGSGIAATTVTGSVGSTSQGNAITSQIAGLSSGTTLSGKGIAGVVVIGSHGLGTGGNSYGIEADLVSQSRGFGQSRGISADRGVIAHSIAKSNNSNTPVIGGKTVVIGVNATNDDIFGGIVLTGGLAVNSYANGFGIEVPDGLVAQSVGRRVLDVGGSQAGIRASTVTGSKGIGSTGVVGILADLIDGSFGSGTGGTTTGTFEFNSN